MTTLKKGLLISGIIFQLAVLLYAAATLLTVEINIDLNGKGTVEVDVFDDYVERGATAQVKFPLLFGYTEKRSVTCKGSVDENITGEYTIAYESTYVFKTKRVFRTVNVTDTTAPVISLEQDFFAVDANRLPLDNDDINIGFSANDNYDGDITDRVTLDIQDGICYYRVTDCAGNVAESHIRIDYEDTDNPKISLKGNDTVYMPVNSEYRELGYTVSDNFDKDISSGVVISSTVDMSKRGTYSVKYTATDAAGNTSSVTRKVVVYGGDYNGEYDTVTPNNKVIYLTFDDGPSIYTERLLDTLSKYNVKATFFVTNQMPKYQYLIARMSNDGHTVGLHTLTHKWDIYSSIESYLNDFNSMNDIIEQRTGSETRFFRFPGGTSNNQGNNYNKGIMVELSEYMLDAGYSYFDWNVDSGDTHLTDPSAIINHLIEQVSKRKTSMILAHDIKKATVDAMPGFIEYALKNGYTFRVIDDSTEAIRFNPKH